MEGAQTIPTVPVGLPGTTRRHQSPVSAASLNPPSALPGQAGGGKASPRALSPLGSAFQVIPRDPEHQDQQQGWLLSPAVCSVLPPRAGAASGPSEGSTWIRWERIGLPGKHSANLQRILSSESKADDESKLNLPTAFLHGRALCFFVDPVSQKIFHCQGILLLPLEDGGEARSVLFCFLSCCNQSVSRVYGDWRGIISPSLQLGFQHTHSCNSPVHHQYHT